MSVINLGLNKHLSNKSYHDDREYISSSGLKLMWESPRDYYNKYVMGISEKPESAALDLGSYIHACILEPEVVKDEFAIYQGFMKRGKEWDAFETANKGKIILTKNQEQEASKLISSFYNAKVVLGDQKNEKEVDIHSFFSKGSPEETVGAEIDGVKVKVRFDYRKEWSSFGSINDIKTTSYVINKKDQVEKICALLHYDVSAALYVDVAELTFNKKHDFFFCFLSKANNEVRIFKASSQMLEKGRQKYRHAIKLLKEARKTGIYYKNVIEELNAIDV